MPSHARFHITLTRQGLDQRTTLSLDAIVADLLAVALGEQPGSPEAHTAVRLWLDKELSSWAAFDPELPVSRQATLLAIRRIANPTLLAALERHQSDDEG
jgi:hypothetical protein